MGATKTLLTAEEFDNYPFEEDKRYELDEGELIEMTKPAYRHNRVLAKLQFELTAYLNKNPIGEALISENLYALSPNTRRSPDVAVILGDRYEELESAKVIPIIPEIAAEVLSPFRNAAHDSSQAEAILRGGRERSLAGRSGFAGSRDLDWTYSTEPGAQSGSGVDFAIITRFQTSAEEAIRLIRPTVRGLRFDAGRGSRPIA